MTTRVSFTEALGLRATWMLPAIAGATLAVVAPAWATDADKGRTIARLWCAACHLVEPGQTTAKVDAPPFATIATTRSAADLRAFLANPYPRMPNMSLSRDEIDDLVGYITALGD